MPDTKLSALTKITSACSVDLVYLAHDPSGTVISAAISASSLFQSIPGTTGLIIGSDTNLYRSAANTLKTDDNFVTLGTITAGSSSQFTFTLVSGSPTLAFTADVNLYRSGANQLETDDNFAVGRGIQATGGITTSASIVIYDNLYMWGSYKKIYFGDTSEVYDAYFWRTSASRIETNGEFVVGSFLTSKRSIYIYQTGEAVCFGDSAGGYDTNLYRSAANTLKTDDALVVVNNIYAQQAIMWYDGVSSYDVGIGRNTVGGAALLWTDDNFSASAIYVGGDAGGGPALSLGITNVFNESISTGVGSIRMSGTTARTNTGFLKIYNASAARYIPYYTTITG